MSAYLCCNSHLSYLAGYAVANGLTSASAESVAELFYIANMRSLLARYGMKAADDGLFQFDASAAWKGAMRGDAAQIIKSAQCFEYQACEFSAWEKTRAFALIEAIRKCALAKTEFGSVEALSNTVAYRLSAWGAPL